MKKEKIKIYVVGGVILKRDNKYLLVQEKKVQAYKLWNLPAGRVDVGETIEEATIREVKEESGYDVELTNKLGVYHENGDEAVKHVFTANIVGGELNVPEDMLDAKWFEISKIEDMLRKNELRKPWVLEAIKDSLND